MRVFLYDFSVFGKKNEHLEHLCLCREAKLSLNPMKCTFGVRNGVLLGHVVSKEAGVSWERSNGMLGLYVSRWTWLRPYTIWWERTWNMNGQLSIRRLSKISSWCSLDCRCYALHIGLISFMSMLMLRIWILDLYLHSARKKDTNIHYTMPRVGCPLLSVTTLLRSARCWQD